MKRFILSLTVIAASIVAASAQTTIDGNSAPITTEQTLPDDSSTKPQMVRGGEFRRHEIGVGYGLYTGPQLFNFLAELFTFSLAEVDLRSTGAVSAGYLYFPIKHIGVGGTLGYQRGNEPAGADFTCSRNYLTAMATAKFYWFNKPYVGMYSSLSAGATYIFGEYNGEKESTWRMAGQVSAVGLEAGGRLRGFIECGFGTMGLFRMGLCVKF